MAEAKGRYDDPYDDITVVIYLTPDLPADCGTSLCIGVDWPSCRFCA